MFRERIVNDGVTFEEAVKIVRKQSIFTTHTPVAAGTDVFPFQWIEKHFAGYTQELGVDRDTLLRLGTHPDDPGSGFNMTVFALRMARFSNAVSERHGEVARKMWAGLWPDRQEADVPIAAITNGVHIPSWLAWQMRQLYDRHFPEGWIQRMGESQHWQDIHNVDPGELWETHNVLKNLLLAFVRRRVSRQYKSLVAAQQEQLLHSGASIRAFRDTQQQNTVDTEFADDLLGGIQLTGFVDKNGAKELFFRSQFCLGLGRHLAHQNISGADFSAKPYNSAVIQIF